MKFSLKTYSEKSVINHLGTFSMVFCLLLLFASRYFFDEIEIPYFLIVVFIFLLIISVSLILFKMTLTEEALYVFTDGIHFKNETIIIDKREIQLDKILEIDIEIKGHKNSIIRNAIKLDGSGNFISIKLKNAEKETYILLQNASEMEKLNSYLKYLEQKKISINYI